MPAQKNTFWTKEKLKELEQLFHKLTRHQLMKRFGKSYEAIAQAYEFQQAHRRMKISSRQHKNMRITIYKPGYAHGAKSQ